MKKQNILFFLSAIFFGAAIAMTILFANSYNTIKQQERIISTLKHDIDSQKKALELSDDIMNNNELWDKDGSDLMSDYLKLRSEIDANFRDGFHENILLDSLSYTYNE